MSNSKKRNQNYNFTPMNSTSTTFSDINSIGNQGVVYNDNLIETELVENINNKKEKTQLSFTNIINIEDNKQFNNQNINENNNNNSNNNNNFLPASSPNSQNKSNIDTNMKIKILDENVESNMFDDDNEIELRKQKIIDLLKKVKNKHSVKLHKAEERNIILVGRTRSGKSTVRKVLEDPSFLPSDLSIFSETQMPEFHHFSVLFDENKYLKLQIVDTPGLFELKPTKAKIEDLNIQSQQIQSKKTKNKNEQKIEIKNIETDNLKTTFTEAELNTYIRDNTTIISTILECIRNEILKINIIIFVCSLHEGVNMQDIEAIKIFSKLFGKNAAKHSMILFTRTETYSDLKISRLINEFKQILEQNDIEEFGCGYCYLGALESNALDNGLYDYVNDALRNITKRRIILYNKIYQKSDFIKIEDLEYFLKNKNEIESYKKRIEELERTIKILEKYKTKDRTNDDTINQLKEEKIKMEEDLKEKIKTAKNTNGSNCIVQ